MSTLIQIKRNREVNKLDTLDAKLGPKFSILGRQVRLFLFESTNTTSPAQNEANRAVAFYFVQLSNKTGLKDLRITYSILHGG